MLVRAEAVFTEGGLELREDSGHNDKNDAVFKNDHHEIGDCENC